MNNPKPYKSNLWEILPELRSVSHVGMALARNSFHLHDLLMYLVDTVSSKKRPLRITITTFSIGEEFSRALAWIKENYPDCHITCIFDNAIKANKKDFLFFGANYIDQIYFTSIHAKIILLDDILPLMVHTSANFTINPRWECTLITGDLEIIQDMKKSLDEVISQSEAYGLYPGTIGENKTICS